MTSDDIEIAASYVPSRFCVYRDINVDHETIDLIAIGKSIMVMIDVRHDTGRVRAHGRYGGGTVLSLNRQPFPDGDPLQNVTHKLFALKKFLHRKAGVKIPIFPVICFPAKTPTFVDLPYTEALTPLQIHVMKRTCLGSYFEYKEKRFHPSHSISETYTKVVEELLVSYLDN